MSLFGMLESPNKTAFSFFGLCFLRPLLLLFGHLYLLHDPNSSKKSKRKQKEGNSNCCPILAEPEPIDVTLHGGGQQSRVGSFLEYLCYWKRRRSCEWDFQWRQSSAARHVQSRIPNDAVWKLWWPAPAATSPVQN